MSEAEPPLTPVERLTIAALYTNLVMSQNRSPLGRLAAERSCYADHDIHRPETLSHNDFPINRGSEGFRAC